MDGYGAENWVVVIVVFSRLGWSLKVGTPRRGQIVPTVLGNHRNPVAVSHKPCGSLEYEYSSLSLIRLESYMQDASQDLLAPTGSLQHTRSIASPD